ncbi:MAG: GNAT family N-acetyltransferase [Polymorphobacter sp.]
MIRPATLADAAAIAAIYAPQVLTGTASFETEAPDTAEMAARLARVLGKGWPWLVWDTGAGVLGYAYAGQFRDRAAYRATCENSIYVAAAAARQGIGWALLRALCDAARAAGFREMIAVIGDGGGNHASVGLHGACGFVRAGILTNVGQKFGRRLDIIYMQRSL